MDDGRIAFVDTVCPKPYSLAALMSSGLGGTEATIVRLAEALDGDVFQHNRDVAEGRYAPMAALKRPRALVVLRDPKAAAALIDRFPGVPVVVWMHDLILAGKDRAKRLAHYRAVLADAGATLVGVSDFHKAQIENALHAAQGAATSAAGMPRVLRIYNPVDERLAGFVSNDVDRDRMIYFSAPAKGLDFALFIHAAIRRQWPKMRLLVANPNYAKGSLRSEDGVIELGSLPQSEVLAHVATALCTFCPNFEYPETFGLVLAESNAVGTPVIAHPIGAAAEVLHDARQIVETPRLATTAFLASRRIGTGRPLALRATELLNGFQPYMKVIDSWREGMRPVVRSREAFKLSTIVAEWKRLLS